MDYSDLAELLSAYLVKAHVSGYTYQKNGKTITVPPHEDRRTRRSAPPSPGSRGGVLFDVSPQPGQRASVVPASRPSGRQVMAQRAASLQEQQLERRRNLATATLEDRRQERLSAAVQGILHNPPRALRGVKTISTLQELMDYADWGQARPYLHARHWELLKDALADDTEISRLDAKFSRKGNVPLSPEDLLAVEGLVRKAHAQGATGSYLGQIREQVEKGKRMYRAGIDSEEKFGAAKAALSQVIQAHRPTIEGQTALFKSQVRGYTRTSPKGPVQVHDYTSSRTATPKAAMPRAYTPPAPSGGGSGTLRRPVAPPKGYTPNPLAPQGPEVSSFKPPKPSAPQNPAPPKAPAPQATSFKPPAPGQPAPAPQAPQTPQPQSPLQQEHIRRLKATVYSLADKARQGTLNNSEKEWLVGFHSHHIRPRAGSGSPEQPSTPTPREAMRKQAYAISEKGRSGPLEDHEKEWVVNFYAKHIRTPGTQASPVKQPAAKPATPQPEPVKPAAPAPAPQGGPRHAIGPKEAAAEVAKRGLTEEDILRETGADKPSSRPAPSVPVKKPPPEPVAPEKVYTPRHAIGPKEAAAEVAKRGLTEEDILRETGAGSKSSPSKEADKTQAESKPDLNALWQKHQEHQRQNMRVEARTDSQGKPKDWMVKNDKGVVLTGGLKSEKDAQRSLDYHRERLKRIHEVQKEHPPDWKPPQHLLTKSFSPEEEEFFTLEELGFLEKSVSSGDKEFLLLCHDDLDGAACEVVGRSILGDIEVEHHNHKTLYPRLDELLKDNLGGFRTVIVADMAPNPQQAQEIQERLGDRILVADHHKSAEYLKKYPWAQFDASKCGSYNLSELLRHKGQEEGWSVSDHSELDKYLSLVDTFDRWQDTSPQWGEAERLNLLFQHLAKEPDGMDRFVSRGPVGVQEEEKPLVKRLVKEKEEFLNRKVKEARVTEDDGNPVVAVEGGANVSQLGNRLLKLHPEVKYIMILEPKEKTVSLYGGGRVDVYQIAKQRGGGGHPAAAGYPADEKTQRWFQEVLSKGYDLRENILRALQKGHVRAHFRVVQGKPSWVRDYSTKVVKKPQEQAGQLGLFEREEELTSSPPKPQAVPATATRQASPRQLGLFEAPPRSVPSVPPPPETKPEPPKSEPPKSEPSPSATEKVPWQMTRKEYFNQERDKIVALMRKKKARAVAEALKDVRHNSNFDPESGFAKFLSDHRQAVEQAIKAKKPVPSQVLRDYPEFQESQEGESPWEKSVRQEEDMIRNASIEHFVGFNSEGEKVVFKKGVKRRVGLSSYDIAAVYGGIFTHNHPGYDVSFSDKDIMTACLANVQECRAVTKQSTYVIKPKPGKTWKDIFQYQKGDTWAQVIGKQVSPIFRGSLKKYTKLMEDGKISVEEANEKYAHEAWTKIAEEKGLTYRRIPRHE